MDERVSEREISAIQLHVNVTVAAPKLLDFKPHPEFDATNLHLCNKPRWWRGGAEESACFQSEEPLQLLSLE